MTESGGIIGGGGAIDITGRAGAGSSIHACALCGSLVRITARPLSSDPSVWVTICSYEPAIDLAEVGRVLGLAWDCLTAPQQAQSYEAIRAVRELWARVREVRNGGA